MKVAHICTKAMNGSVGCIARNISKKIDSSGGASIICYARGSEMEGSGAFRFNNKFGVYSHALLSRVFDSDGLHSKKPTIKLIRFLEEFKPDIIHLHCLHGYYINYPLLFKYLKESKIKVVWTMHDCWAYTGHCTHYFYSNCMKWKTGCNQCPEKKEYPKSLICDKSKRNFDLKKKTFTLLPSDQMIIVTPSRWLMDEIQQSFLNKYQIKLINNDVDSNIFNSIGNVKIEKRILGVANVWTKRKGLEDFISLKKYIPSDYKILIVGATEKQIKTFSKFGIKAITRTSNQNELAELYRNSTILFNPTYEDNYPTVNLEAISCGLPVVTYRTGGSPESIELTGLGIIIQNKDYNSVVNYLDQAFNRRIEKKGVLSYNMTEKYLKLYSELIQDGK